MVTLAMDILLGLLGVFLFYVLITFIWQQAEFEIYGKKTTRALDDAVAIILAISLYFNFFI